jgi:outer membrane biosynthesis protein TonB
MGSVALHVAVAAALLISWRFERNLKFGSAVPVTIVTDAPTQDVPAAVEAPETQTAQAEQPAPQAPPEPTPPTPQPAPEPPQPRPAAAKPAPPKPAPKPQPTPKAEAKPKPEKSLDLDALAATLSKMTRTSGAKASSAPRGPARAATAPQASKGLSQGGQAALEGLVSDLERRWNPNCEVEGGRDVVVRVSFSLSSTGQLVGDVGSQIASSQTPAAKVGEERAVRAVYAAAPFKSLPRELYGQKIIVNFDAKRACSL